MMHKLLQSTGCKDGVEIIFTEINAAKYALLLHMVKHKKLCPRLTMMFMGGMLKLERVIDWLETNDKKTKPLSSPKIKDAKQMLSSYGAAMVNTLRSIDAANWHRWVETALTEIVIEESPETQIIGLSILDSMILALSIVDEERASDCLLAARELFSGFPSRFQALAEASQEVTEDLMILEDDAYRVVWDAIESFTIH